MKTVGTIAYLLALIPCETMARSPVSSSAPAPPATASAPAPASAPASRPAEPPNILFIILDDAHYQCFAAAGHGVLKTPNLDALAARSALFTQATVAVSLCAPSRATYLTGRYSHTHGVRTNPKGDDDDDQQAVPERKSISIPMPTVINLLRDAGYDTGLFGKWHLAMLEQSPRDCGFNTFWLDNPGLMGRVPWAEGNVPHKVHEYARDRDRTIAAVLLHFIEHRTTQRFFAWAAFRAPHVPQRPARPYRMLYRELPDEALVPPGHVLHDERSAEHWRGFAAVMSQVDETIGVIVRKLEELGLMERTAIFIASDNGFSVGEHGHFGKIVAWEDSIRIPMMVWLPTAPKRGVKIDAPVSSVDLPATWLDLAGVPAPEFIAGRSIAPLLLRDGDVAWRDAAIVEYDHDTTNPSAPQPYRLVRTREHKLVLRRDGQISMFDISNDPTETRDLAGGQSRSELRDALVAKLREWMQRTNDRTGLAWLAASASRPATSQAATQGN